MKSGIYILLVLFLGIGQLFAQLSPGELSKPHKNLDGLTNCTKCHDLGNSVPDKKCLDCHIEISKLINQQSGYHVSKEVKSKRCIQCHNEHHGRNFEIIRFNPKTFNHNLTNYPLVGKHKQTDCKDCHQPKNIKDKELKKRPDTFLGLQQNCLSCHDDYHQGTLPENCIKCHDLNGFKPASKFNHNKSLFALKGAHKKVDCGKCHPVVKRNNIDFQKFNGLYFSKCTDCHQDKHMGKFGDDCLSCHSETSFKKVKMNTSFNHDLTGFPLSGLHKSVACEECHGIQSSKNRNSKLCYSCHEDFHKGAFKKQGQLTDCQSCHTVKEPFSYTSFGLKRHSETKMPLNGAHQATPCFSCHWVNNKWTFSFGSTQCIQCHEDIHTQKIDSKYYPANNCRACHNEELWSSVNFNHQITGWELEGKHKQTSCRDCHSTSQEGEFKELQVFQALKNECVQCHENIHGQQFEIGGKTDCKRCHEVAWTWDSKYFNHSNTQFPLEGKHLTIDCKACHPTIKNNLGQRITNYKIPQKKCIDCHL